MRITCWSLFLLLILIGCTPKHDHKGRTPLAELNDKFLYKEDLQGVIPYGISEQDSLDFVKTYICNWAKDLLLYEKAKRNIPNSVDIDHLVENYRRDLILHAYQQEMIRQKLNEEVSEKELQNYYEKNHMLFQLEHPLMKGVFIKVPLTSPKINHLRRWVKIADQNAIENLEKYSLQYAVKYEYFNDKWLPVNEILDWMPLSVDALDASLKREKPFIELSDTAFQYFLNVNEYRAAGEQEPYEFAKIQVMEVLQNLKQVDFINRMKEELYLEAEEDKRIKIY